MWPGGQQCWLARKTGGQEAGQKRVVWAVRPETEGAANEEDREWRLMEPESKSIQKTGVFPRAD